MKILKIVLLSFLGLALVSLAAVLVFIKTFDGNRYKPQIVGAVKSVVDRDVDFARAGLDISWDLDISFKISDLAVSENGAFGGGDFLHIKEISVSLDIPALIFKKQLLVSAVNIMGPRLTIIRNKDGAVNAATLVKQPPQNAGTDAGAGIPAAGAALAFPLSVSALNIYDGTIVYLDKSFQPPLSVSV
ncbi:MAG: AsmA family protein, partial [Candidatus Omnitrophica bacterium]|nr:AsmA family protein [Candidatus Omnitrophota bacterium]